MIPILSPEHMRRTEQCFFDTGIPSRVLMERAAQGIFNAYRWTSPVAVLCGSGNNGGDGYALSLLLRKGGIDCTVFVLSEPVTEDSRFFHDLCLEQKIPLLPFVESTILSAFPVIVDCIFGTGFHGEATGLALAAIRAVNLSGSFVISADINSGLNSRNGLYSECVNSDLTVAVGYYKTGHFLGKASDVIKQLTCCDLGIDALEYSGHLLEAQDVACLMSPRLHFSNKADYGYIGLVGGCDRYSGAIRLASLANAAMRSGTGVIKIASPASLAPVLGSCILESTLFPLSCDESGHFVFVEDEWKELIRGLKVIAFGMGFGKSRETARALQFLLEHYSGLFILDADGLNLLAECDPDRIENRACTLLLTPHLKEFSRLSAMDPEEILADPVGAVNALARKYRATVLLKGPCSLISDGNETYFVNAGCPGMATAGSGDVLSGIAAAVCAYFPCSSALRLASAAYINGKAGELAEAQIGPVSMIAGDTVAAIPSVMQSLSAL